MESFDWDEVAKRRPVANLFSQESVSAMTRRMNEVIASQLSGGPDSLFLSKFCCDGGSADYETYKDEGGFSTEFIGESDNLLWCLYRDLAVLINQGACRSIGVEMIKCGLEKSFIYLRPGAHPTMHAVEAPGYKAFLSANAACDFSSCVTLGSLPPEGGMYLSLSGLDEFKPLMGGKFMRIHREDLLPHQGEMIVFPKGINPVLSIRNARIKPRFTYPYRMVHFELEADVKLSLPSPIFMFKFYADTPMGWAEYEQRLLDRVLPQQEQSIAPKKSRRL